MKFLPVQQWLGNFNDWVGQMGVAGIFIFIGVYAVATVLLAPGAILTIGAGFAFGLWKGFLAVSAGATLGASLAFLVARFIARDKVEAIAKRNEKFRNIDNAIGKQGAKLVFLLRLSPVIPFNLSNYFYGLTGVKFWPYVLASWIGMMPGTFLYVYIGTAGKAAVSAAAGGEADETRLAILDVPGHRSRGYDHRDNLGNEDCAQRVERKRGREMNDRVLGIDACTGISRA